MFLLKKTGLNDNYEQSVNLLNIDVKHRILLKMFVFLKERNLSWNYFFKVSKYL